MSQEANFLNEFVKITSGNPYKWMPSGASCFLYSPNNPAYFTCKYFDARGSNTISISTIDLNGDTLKERVVNENTNPLLYNEYLKFYNQVKIIAQKNANEEFFKTMVTHYPPPNLFNKL